MPRPDATERLAATKPKQGPPTALIASIVVVVLLIGGFAAFLVSQNNSKTATGTIPKGGISKGNGINPFPGVAKAGVPTVDLYEDFQCPICNELEKANGAQIAQMAQSGQIKLQYHMMTFLDDNFGTDSSKIAANASYCAADAGKFEPFHKATYAAQPPEAQEQAHQGFTTAQVKTFGKTAGITGAALTTFNSCVDSNKYKDYVSATETKSGQNGVTSTPSIFVNGKQISQSSADYSALLQTPNSFQSVLAKYSK